MYVIILNMNQEELKVLNQMYKNIDKLLKDVDELKLYKTHSETAIRSLIQTNRELTEEVKKLKSVATIDTPRVSFTQLPPAPTTNSYGLSNTFLSTKDQLFTPVNSTKKN